MLCGTKVGPTINILTRQERVVHSRTRVRMALYNTVLRPKGAGQRKPHQLPAISQDMVDPYPSATCQFPGLEVPRRGQLQHSGSMMAYQNTWILNSVSRGTNIWDLNMLRSLVT